MSRRFDRISLAEPITELRHVPIIECGEPLVDYLALCPRLVQDRPRFVYTRATLARKSVTEALCQASERLPKGYRLAVIEGWRPHHIQRRMYNAVWSKFRELHPDWSDVQMRRTVNRYTAPLSAKVPPPHSTGGAVDVMLADEQGNALDMNSPYDDFDRHSYPLEAPGLTPAARRHRQIMADALSGTVLTNYPSEFWHWTYGDQGWAYRGGHPHALYGPIQPPNYVPPPGDDIDEPLEMLFGKK